MSVSKLAPIITLLAVGLAPASPVPERAVPQPPPARARLSPDDLLEQVLLASGVSDPARRAQYGAQFRRELERVIDRVGAGEPTYRRARRLHKVLHKELFDRYRSTADGIPSILDDGDYNCVSASLFYGMAALALGFDVQVVESPRHVFLRLQIGRHEVDVETTSPRGFDLRRLGRFRELSPATQYLTPEELRSRDALALFEELDELIKPASLEAAVAFLWHNTGLRALDRGDALLAAESFLEEFRRHPDLTSRSNQLPVSLARAFRIEYDRGEFERAQRIAEIDLTIFPGRITARDRLLAAALKRIEAACEKGKAPSAERILQELQEGNATPEDLIRLEREACPLIAAGAVRVGNWELAMRMAELYAAAEPDTVESARLRDWIQDRRHGPYCSAPRRLTQAPPLSRRTVDRN